MKIIDNKKDYYDYVSGILGIDPDVTYDRRNSVRLVNIGKPNGLLPSGYTEYANSFAKTCFSTEKDAYYSYYNLKYNYGRTPWFRYGRHYKKDETKPFWSTTYTVGVEAGWYMYIFELEKTLEKEDSKVLTLKPTFICKNRLTVKNTDAPLAFGECRTYERINWRNVKIEPTNIDSFFLGEVHSNIIKNPILANTWIPKFIKAEDIWNDIYDYLISQREKPIIDNRSDILHLEAAGFDKKTSFRNM